MGFPLRENPDNQNFFENHFFKANLFFFENLILVQIEC